MGVVKMRTSLSNTTGSETKKTFSDFFEDLVDFDKQGFIQNVCEMVAEQNAACPSIYQVQVSMLADQLMICSMCRENIAANGLVVDYGNGMKGKNQHISIKKDAVASALTIMTALCLTPKTMKKAFPGKPNPEFERFMRGPLG